MLMSLTNAARRVKPRWADDERLKKRQLIAKQ
jgi:hypothetical protein